MIIMLSVYLDLFAGQVTEWLGISVFSQVGIGQWPL